jgi:hypothetical protein
MYSETVRGLRSRSAFQRDRPRTMPDDTFVREKARAAVRDGTIPNRRPDGSWARPGGDSICSICKLLITFVQMEFELHFARNGDKAGVDEFHIHIRCFSAWEREQKRKR